jgi:hypothetical protein
MAKSFYLLILFISAPFFNHICGGQTFYVDSVPVVKPEPRKNIFIVQDSVQFTILYEELKLAAEGKKPRGGGLLTLVTGIGTTATSDLIWWFRSLQKIEKNLDWNIYVLCNGRFIKDRTRVRDSEGVSVETETIREFYWNMGGKVLIAEGTDTIGTFALTISPLEDFQDDFLTFRTRNIEPLRSRLSNRFIPAEFPSYELNGTLRESRMKILSDGKKFKTWVYSDSNLKCVFFHDLDEFYSRKVERAQPFMIIESSILGRERVDLYRISIICRYLNEIVRKNRD